MLIFIKIISVLVLNFVSADLISMEKQLAEKLRNITSLERVFTGTIANAITRLDGYGCWCYFSEDAQ